MKNERQVPIKLGAFLTIDEEILIQNFFIWSTYLKKLVTIVEYSDLLEITDKLKEFRTTNECRKFVSGAWDKYFWFEQEYRDKIFKIIIKYQIKDNQGGLRGLQLHRFYIADLIIEEVSNLELENFKYNKEALDIIGHTIENLVTERPGDNLTTNILEIYGNWEF